MALKFYYDMISQPCRALYVFLKMTSIPYEAKPVALRKDEHKTEEFRKLNPGQYVPVIDDNGFILTESVAILKFLAQKYKVSDNWYPSDPMKQIRVDEFCNWQHTTLRFATTALFRELFKLAPKEENRTLDMDRVALYRTKMEGVVDHMGSVFLKDQPYLCGQDISIADLLGVCELMQLYSVKHEGFVESNVVVNKWFENVKEQSQPYLDESHKIIYQARKSFEKMNS